ncbi:MAG: efflux RND transporter permease subunit [Candidatus Hydrogenedentes bacterium]|nr:efflux RND transporter permease subunit [Candidatus Hydrogenedentota bacterium]
MLERMTRAALERRFLVLCLFLCVAGAGVWTLTQLPVDAFPDTSNIQVQVNTVAPALNGEEIEQQITQPVELALGGLPGLEEVRSISKFGLSQVVAVFSDDTGIYDARQFILERLSGVTLPEGVEPPQLGPISSGLGEIFAYVLRSPDGSHSLEELRTLHDWVIKPQLIKTPGVAEVTAWGGFEKQYQVIAQPERLREYRLTLDDVIGALERNNANVGGGQLTASGQAVLVHGLGRVSSLDEIAAVPITTVTGVPVRVGDVAEVAIGHEIRRGAVTFGGEGEVVLGLGYMLQDGNSREVASALRRQLEQAKTALPPGVSVDVVYDRTELVEHVLKTVRENLIAGAVLVVIVLFLLFGSLRGGLLVAVTIPMAMLCAVLGMYGAAIAASLLSLGAIDFGILVDGSVIMTDANLRALRELRRKTGRKPTWRERLDAMIASAREVARPVVFGMGIILIVFLPILTLEGAEGKMFRPMAFTFIFGLAGALAIALFLTPVLSYYLLPAPKRVEEGVFLRGAKRLYGGLLRGALAWRGIVAGGVLVLAAAVITLAPRLGGEFLPRLSESAIVINVIRLPGVALEESVAYNTRMEQLMLEQFPDEIEAVWSRVGTADVATDPMGIELSDVFMTLKPREQWTRAKTQAELAALMEQTLHDLPGQNLVFTQPIELRMNELTAGIRADVGIKVIGDHFEELARIAEEVETVLHATPGAADISVDQVTGLPTLQIRVNQEAAARQGIPASEILTVVEALGNKPAGEVIEAQRKFPLTVRLPDRLRRDRQALEETIFPSSSGAEVPLAQVAGISETEGLANINREWGRRLVRVQANVRGRDVMSFVQDAERGIRESVALPEGYLIEWGGQFEHLTRARQRLLIVVPLALVLVFFMLYASLNSLKDVLIVYTGIPFAALGGILGLYCRGIPFSVSAAVGFIALSGIAVLDGQVMVAAIRGFREQGQSLVEAVLEGARQRLLPVLATSITDALGFLPMMLSTGIGAEVQRPLATVVVCGVISCTVLTLFLLPVFYVMVSRGREAEGA